MTGPGDECTRRLARLFREHPAWVAAARELSPDATSGVYFSHQPGRAWHLEQRSGVTRLAPGLDPDPDLVFRFTPAAIQALESVEGGIGDFAVALFSMILDEQVDLRIAARFPRLAARGYLKLLVAAGPRVLAFGAAHGIRTLAGLRRFVANRSAGGPAAWEREDEAS